MVRQLLAANECSLETRRSSLAPLVITLHYTLFIFRRRRRSKSSLYDARNVFKPGN